MAATIPEPLKEMMRNVEVANMRARKGWAVGTVKRVDEDGEVSERCEQAWIELFNGEGRASRSGGVRFMWFDESADWDENKPWESEGYYESYAYPGRRYAKEATTPPYWFVSSWETDDVNYAIPTPQ